MPWTPQAPQRCSDDGSLSDLALVILRVPSGDDDGSGGDGDDSLGLATLSATTAFRIAPSCRYLE